MSRNNYIFNDYYDIFIMLIILFIYHIYLVLYGFLVVPNRQLLLSHHIANSETFVNTRGIAPADLINFITSASVSAIVFFRRTRPAVCCIFATLIQSCNLIIEDIFSFLFDYNRVIS